MKWLSILVAVVLVLCLVPLAYAAEVTGKFTVKARAPQVNALEIYLNKDCTVPATTMTPQMTYYARATITQQSGLKHLKKVEVYVYYDASGTDPVEPGAPNPQTCALLTWTADPESWTINAGDSVTWSIVEADCSRPSDLNAATGNWVFAFRVGKVATMTVSPADWDGKGIATNRNDRTGTHYVRDKGMNWYGEVTVHTTSVDWGEVDPGLTFGASPNPRTNIQTNYIANGDFATTIKGTDWSGIDHDAVLDEEEAEPPAGSNEFALKANDANNYTGAQWVKKDDVTISNTGTQTTESGVSVNTNTLWLSLSEEFEADVYSGAIYYGIRNR